MIRQTTNETYPKREKAYAIRFGRALLEAKAASVVGMDGCFLLMAIALAEDEEWYRKPPTFTNEQLGKRVGVNGRKSIPRLRAICQRAGWLYCNRSTLRARQPAVYWVLVPSQFSRLMCTQNGTHKESNVCTQNGTQVCTESGPHDAVMCTQNGTPSSLRKNPKNPKREEVAAGAAVPLLNEILETWNQELGQRCKLTESRARSLKARLAQATWRERWREGISIASRSNFLRGENDRGWKADFDFFVRPDSLQKILEGKYDGKPSAYKSLDDRFRKQRDGDFDALLENPLAVVNGVP